MRDFDDVLATVSRALGHDFADLGLLRDALTHRSFANERPRLAPRDNERLEFLGDSVFGLAAAGLLFERFPDAPEGELTRRRADLVCEATLADVAGDLGLGDALRLGRGEKKTGGQEKPRLLASALEACLGAVFVDAGGAAADAVARGLLDGRVAPDAPGARDFKSRVQQIVQGRRAETPRYRVLDARGPDHARTFRVALVVEGEVLAEGEGRSKVDAEQAAAEVAWRRLSDEDGPFPPATGGDAG